MFTLAHLSDLHLPLPPMRLRDFFSKRLMGWLNWKRERQFIHNPEILARLVSDMRAQNPDHIAVVGDFTNLGLEREYIKTRDWLLALAEPSKVSIVPGNHDAYVKGALLRGLRNLSEWMPAPFPYSQEHGDVALVHVSTAIPTPPLLSVGFISEKQLERLAQLLHELKQKGKFRVVLMHHAPSVSGKDWSKRLINSDALHKVLRATGAELVLHGHLHRSTYCKIGEAHVMGVPSASADPAHAKNPAGYALYHIGKKDGGWQVEVTRREIGDSLNFETTEKIQLNMSS